MLGQVCCEKHKKNLIIIAMVLLATIVIVSIIREKLVSENNNQVTVYGQGRVSYQPDEATVILGVQVDKAETAEQALTQINTKIAKFVEALGQAGIDEKDIETQTYSLNPHYDYSERISKVSGYDASQNLAIKIRDIKDRADMVSSVISIATSMGINKVSSVNFTVSDPSSLKQQARIAAIKDARAKSGELFKVSGVKTGKVLGWYENFVQSPDTPQSYGGYGMGGSDAMVSAKAVPAPQVPSGTQEIVVEIGVNYEVR